MRDNYFKTQELKEAHEKLSGYVQRHARKIDRTIGVSVYWNKCVDRFKKPVSEWDMDDFEVAADFARRIVSYKPVDVKKFER